MLAERDSETAPVLPPPKPPPIYKGPPRPAPTLAYDFRDYNPKPTIFYVRTVQQAKSALATFTQSGPLGFDLEWRPTYKKGAPENPVALIQLANYHSIVLFQVSCMQGFPSELRQILESSHIVKAGVGIQGDAKKLFRDCNVSMRNCVDLSLLARTADNAQWAGTYNSPIGLARLIECYEYKLLLKGKVSRSDWTAVLTPKQQEYAGNDAHAGYILYKKLEAMMALMPSLPEEAWYSFNVLRGILCNDDGLPWEPKNPAYDPGPLPEVKPPTEAQLQLKQKRADSRAAQQALSSVQVEGVPAVVSGVQPILNPSFPPASNSQPSIIYSVPQAGLPALNSMSTRTPPGFTMRQVSGYHHSAGKQTTARNNSQDQRFQSTSTSRSGTIGCLNPQSTAQVFQPRPFPGTGKRHTHPISGSTTGKQHGHHRRWPHPGPTSNRLLSVNTRDNLVPTTTHVRANP